MEGPDLNFDIAAGLRQLAAARGFRGAIDASLETPFWERDAKTWLAAIVLCGFCFILQIVFCCCWRTQKKIFKTVTDTINAEDDRQKKDLSKILENKSTLEQQINEIGGQIRALWESHELNMESEEREAQAQKTQIHREHHERIEELQAEHEEHEEDHELLTAKQQKLQKEEEERHEQLRLAAEQHHAEHEIIQKEIAHHESIAQEAEHGVNQLKIHLDGHENENDFIKKQEAQHAIAKANLEAELRQLFAEKEMKTDQFRKAHAVVHQTPLPLQPSDSDLQRKLALQSEVSQLEIDLQQVKNELAVASESEILVDEKQAQWQAELDQLNAQYVALEQDHERCRNALKDESTRVRTLSGEVEVYETRVQAYHNMRNMIQESHDMLDSFQQSLAKERAEKAQLQEQTQHEQLRTQWLVHILRHFKEQLAVKTANPADATDFGDPALTFNPAISIAASGVATVTQPMAPTMVPSSYTVNHAPVISTVGQHLPTTYARSLSPQPSGYIPRTGVVPGSSYVSTTPQSMSYTPTQRTYRSYR